MTQAATLGQATVKKALDTYFGGMSRLDMHASISAFAPDGVSDDPRGSGVQRGRAAIEAYFSGLASALESFTIAPTSIYPSGDGVAVHWQATWRGRNGRSGTFTGIDAITIDAAGQITELVGYWDAGTVLAEMSAT
ncbi:MAG TPA: nuclear transport factor 2 family protein [Candidatus Dormibacteraeota bacterium]|nr:nuclear transport factor 2 family protein [Candidatus Dormibacteraeota bacterium]